MSSAREDLLRFVAGSVTPALEGGYKTILSDYPWPSSKPNDKIKRSHWMGTNMKPRYGTLKAKDLLEFPIADIAARDAVHVMWTTWMHLDLAMKCIEISGFKYCAGFPWLKVCKPGRQIDDLGYVGGEYIRPIYGPGVWAQGCTELVLISRRGRPFGSQGNPRPARKGLIIAPRGEHSEKPGELQDWIDAKFPGPKIELFARRTRPGWDVWGNEVSQRRV